MATIDFKGFGGVRLSAESAGDEHDPAILLVRAPGQPRAVWHEVAQALVQSGRRVFSLDLRGHGRSAIPADGRTDAAAHAEDLRAVLAQLGCRPVVVAAGLAGWMALAALETDAALLAAGLVLIDLPANAPALARLETTGRDLALPVLLVGGGMDGPCDGPDAASLAAAVPDAQSATISAADLAVVTDRTEALLSHVLAFLDRKQPRAATEFRAGSDARTLRDAMGCFTTGITIVTANDGEGMPIGLTANSFTSLSLDPPLLLVCIANRSGSAPVLRGAEHFGVNVLQTGQQAASNRFAGRGEDRFAATPWAPGETGVPLLDGSLVSFECRRHAVHDGGDHFILVGEVMRAQFEPRRDPLLYFRGKYRRLHFA